MNPSEQFADWTTLRTIRVQAVATFILRETLKQLTALEKDLRGALLLSDLSGQQSAREQRRALREFAEAVEAKISEVYAEILERVETEFQILADKEDEAQRELFGLFGKVKDGQPFNSAGLVILGATLASWFGKQAGDLQFRVIQSVRQGVEAGEDESQLQKRVRGGTGKDGLAIPRPLDTSERAAEVIIRTGATQIQNEVTEDLAEQLPPTIDYGWQQISILDNRTTEICKAYAFKIWTKDYKPLGHKLPFNGGVPRHPNCRSRIVLYMLDDGPTKELTFRQWMDKLTPEQQGRIFGKERIKLWKAGKLTDQDLIRQQWRAIRPQDINNNNDNDD